MNLGKDVKVSSALTYASGTADRTGTILDMANWDGVMIIFEAHSVATGATVSIKAQQGDESDLSDAADLEGSGITVADDDDGQIFIIDLYRPTDRYVRLYLDNDAANAVAASAMYVQYAGRVKPVTQNVDDAVTYELHVSPAEGTA